MKEMTEIEKIDLIEHPLIAVLWRGEQIFVKVRELSDLQIQAIGNMSLIEVEKGNTNFDWRAWEKFAEQQHEIVRASLVSPTYEQLFEMIGKSEFSATAEQRFIEISKEISLMDRGPAKKAAEQKYSSLRALFDLVLPNDFTASITQYALGTAKSDIKLITKDILWQCYILHKRCGGRPSDYCNGRLNDFNKRDIDNAALYYGDKRMELERKQKGGK